MIKRAWNKAIGLMVFTVLNMITLGTIGNIAIFIGSDEDYRETYEPVAFRMGITFEQFKWFAAVLNTVTLGIPHLAMAIHSSVMDIKRAYDWKEFMEFENEE